jgi:aminoglycoside phosphotransferase (APT) family kinase protein
VLTPRFRRSRHIVVLVLAAKRGEPVLVAKIPRLRADADALLLEATNLRAVARALGADDEGTVPTVVTLGSSGGRPLLLETAVAGRPLSPRAVRRARGAIGGNVAGWLERLASATGYAAFAGTWYERLVGVPLRRLADEPSRPAAVRELAERTLEHAEVLRDVRLPLVFTHGDFAHPNLLTMPDGRLGVLDWERADPAGLPAEDLFFFLAYASHREGERAFFGRRPWAWRLAERYAERTGLDAALLRPLLAVSCARAHVGDLAAERMTPFWRAALAG